MLRPQAAEILKQQIAEVLKQRVPEIAHEMMAMTKAKEVFSRDFVNHLRKKRGLQPIS